MTGALAWLEKYDHSKSWLLRESARGINTLVILIFTLRSPICSHEWDIEEEVKWSWSVVSNSLWPTKVDWGNKRIIQHILNLFHAYYLLDNFWQFWRSSFTLFSLNPSVLDSIMFNYRDYVEWFTQVTKFVSTDFEAQIPNQSLEPALSKSTLQTFRVTIFIKQILYL